MSNVRDDLKAIYTAGISSVNPENAIYSHLKYEKNILTLYSNNEIIKNININVYDKIFIVGAGKATAPMAKAVESMLKDRISKGLIIVKYDYLVDLSYIKTIEAAHPVPDANGVVGAKEIKNILDSAKEDDLVISLISGGGSALLPLPHDSITLEEKRETTEQLLISGATIHEINTVRKHLSLVKGGGLARAAYPATVLNLMISDVVGDDMDVIASGPFVHDNSTFEQAKEILLKYDLLNRLPQPIINCIESGISGVIEENPNEKSPVFEKVTNCIIASNIIALEAARKEAKKRGYNTLILSSQIDGDTKEVSGFHSAIAMEIAKSSNPIKKPACVISGGETTVKVHGHGLGGRNMEFAMHAAVYIKDCENIFIASIGTDGTDGPTDAAGALADCSTIKRARDKGLDVKKYIENNDSYHFFKEIDDLIITGPTNTNVMDIRIMIVY